MAAPGLFTSVQFIDRDNPMTIAWVAIVMILSIVLSFVLTLVIGFDDLPVEEENLKEIHLDQVAQTVSIKSPVTGKVKKLSEVADEVFSKEVLGKGFAVVPSNGQIVSPITGTVTAVFPTKHAIGITSDKGLEVLVHIGIDTVTLEGKGFTSNIKMGDKIYQGTPIVEVDLALIEAAGLATDTIVVVTNSAEYANFTLLEKDEVSEGEVILDVEK